MCWEPIRSGWIMEVKFQAAITCKREDIKECKTSAAHKGTGKWWLKWRCIVFDDSLYLSAMYEFVARDFHESNIVYKQNLRTDNLSIYTSHSTPFSILQSIQSRIKSQAVEADLQPQAKPSNPTTKDRPFSPLPTSISISALPETQHPKHDYKTSRIYAATQPTERKLRPWESFAWYTWNSSVFHLVSDLRQGS